MIVVSPSVFYVCRTRIYSLVVIGVALAICSDGTFRDDSYILRCCLGSCKGGFWYRLEVFVIVYGY